MLGAQAVGNRVVVRSLVRGATAPSGRPLLTDVIGVLESWADGRLGVRRSNGELVEIALADVVAGKVVPPRAEPRLRIEAGQLQRVCSAGWPARTVEPLGDWLLREAGGFTGRANSALVSGEPDRPVDAALAVVASFYARHDLPTRAQVVLGSVGEAAILREGWVDARPAEGGVLVQVASLASARRRARAARPTGRIGVRVDDRLDDDWLGLYGRAAGMACARAVLAGGERVGFARVGSPALAIGRAVVTGDWLGLSAVEVAPAHRRQGFGYAIVDALLGWAAARGAVSAYLQVTPGNAAALALYAGYGFATHHRYRYLRPPG